MDFIDLLHDPAYRHMLLNHVPIVGLFVSWLVLALGLLLKQRELLLPGLGLVAITAGTALPVANYGDAAYPSIYDGLDGAGRGWLDYHAEVAATWLPALLWTAGCALAALLAGLLKPRLLFPAALLTALVALSGLGAAILIGQAGGKVKHPEFRISDPPAVAVMQGRGYDLHGRVARFITGQ